MDTSMHNVKSIEIKHEHFEKRETKSGHEFFTTTIKLYGEDGEYNTITLYSKRRYYLTAQ